MTPAPLLKRLVIVNDAGSVNGGATQVAIAGALALARRGLPVDYLCAFGPVDARLREASCRVTCLDQTDLITDPRRLRAAWRGLWNDDARAALAGILDDLDRASTVVHIHTWVKSLSPAVPALAVERGFPTVVTLHDYFLACPNGGFYNYQAQQACPLVPLSAQCLLSDCDSRSRLHKAWRVVRQLIQLGPGKLPSGIRDFIAVSDYSARLLMPYLPNHARIHPIDNPIETSRSAPFDIAAQERFAFVGRLAPEKGPVIFARAAAQAGVQALFIGEGPCRAEIASICPTAEITGWLPSVEVTARLTGVRAVVLPSLWHETQGLVVNEAAALGIPALVSDRCAARDAIVHGESGFHFDPHDSNSLSEKLRELAGDHILLRRLGANAHARFWRNPPTAQRHGDQLLTCYEQMLTHFSDRNTNT